MDKVSFIPKDKLPECWNDEVRMNALLSPVRSLKQNPLDRKDKVTFWRSVIRDWCFHNQQHLVSVSDIERSVRKDNRSPACLALVLEEMVRDKELISYSEFTDIPPQQNWSSWTVGLLAKPVQWTLQKIRDSVSAPTKSDHVYVHVATVKEHANKILAAVQGNKRDTLLDAREIQDICLTGSIENIELALYWLHGQGLAAVTHFKCDGRLLAKFGKLPGEKIVISEVDYGVYSLKWNEKKLSESLAKLEAQVDAAVTDAREYVRKGNRSLAKNCLKKKHAFGKLLEKRSEQLSTVQVLMSHIEEAHSESEIIAAYKAGARTLQTILKGKDLTLANVENVVLDLGDVLDEHDDIQEALSRPVKEDSAEDKELEAELSELLDAGGDAATPPPPPPGSRNLDSGEDEELRARLDALSLNVSWPEVPDAKEGRDPKETVDLLQ